MLIAISMSQNTSLGDLFEVLHVSSVCPKENAPLAFSARTEGRPVYIVTKEMIEQLGEP